jgi:hypothetical protein
VSPLVSIAADLFTSWLVLDRLEDGHTVGQGNRLAALFAEASA